jgi:hypothetical protein
VTALDGLPLWVSEAEPGSVYDIIAALHALPALYRAAAGGLPTWPTRAMRVLAGHPHPASACAVLDAFWWAGGGIVSWTRTFRPGQGP